MQNHTVARGSRGCGDWRETTRERRKKVCPLTPRTSYSKSGVYLVGVAVGVVFCRPLRVQSMAAASSVEERIHRNIGSVQRTRTKLDGNFLHK